MKKTAITYGVVILAGSLLGMQLPAFYNYCKFKIFNVIPEQIQIGDNSIYYEKYKSGVLVYGASWCEACTKTRNFLDKANVQYMFLDVEKDPNAKNDLLQFKMGGIPVTLVKNQRILGYSPSIFESSIAKLPSHTSMIKTKY